MTRGTVVALGLAPEGGEPIVALERIEVDGEGVLGDRYRTGKGSWPEYRTSSLTLISTGQVAAAARELGASLDPLALRRNVVVDFDGLDDLVGKRFEVGTVVLEGERPCDPCRSLEVRLGLPGLKAALRGRGGLRARVVHGGVILIGDPVTPMDVLLQM